MRAMITTEKILQHYPLAAPRAGNVSENEIKLQQGFTLIELLIVVAITGIILTTIIIPAYQDCAVWAQVSEGLNLAATAKADQNRCGYLILSAVARLPGFLIISGAVLLGLIAGSFLNVVIYRLPLMIDREWRKQASQLLSQPGEPEPAEAPINLISPRSHCPACNSPVAARHNVPVLSYLLLQGRCATCDAKISPRYPLIELLSALLSATIIWKFGPTLAGAAALVLGWALIALSAIDLEHQLLPDSITQPLLWLALALSLSGLLTDIPPFPDLQSSVLGAIAGYLSLWTVCKVFKRLTGKEGVGYGDFKLLAALGGWLGWQMMPLVIMLSALVGSLTGIALIVVGRRIRWAPIPFGPFLAGAGLCALIWGPNLMSAYVGMRGT